MELKYGNRKVTAVDDYLVVGKKKMKVSELTETYYTCSKLEPYLLVDLIHIEFGGGITGLMKAFVTSEKGTDTYRELCRWVTEHGETV